MTHDIHMDSQCSKSGFDEAPWNPKYELQLVELKFPPVQFVLIWELIGSMTTLSKASPDY